MVKKASIPGTIEAWENRDLGADEAHVRRTSDAMHDAIEDALGLKAISIRLPKSTIDTYKALAQMHGVGYQPLMRDAICRWADGELRQMALGAAQGQQPKPPQPDTMTPEPPFKKVA